MLTDVDVNREHIDTSEASQKSGYSNVHLTRLLRNGTLAGFKVGRDWFVYTDSLEKYLATPRKSGPKGPIKKSKHKNENVEASN